jgi:hypothetical protein
VSTTPPIFNKRCRRHVEGGSSSVPAEQLSRAIERAIEGVT